jgi:hypothetical protein
MLWLHKRTRNRRHERILPGVSGKDGGNVDDLRNDNVWNARMGMPALSCLPRAVCQAV